MSQVYSSKSHKQISLTPTYSNRQLTPTQNDFDEKYQKEIDTKRINDKNVNIFKNLIYRQDVWTITIFKKFR